ncbi:MULTISPECIES: DUF928 domain-containing protein [Oscillatoriales]|uniref:DUF928 domain-containing protein n=1 Tax=Aerosakkonema funiforme FACHB-1375 TaxID=2949571 RepID=A0A926V9K3_9CYAN|nr:MULTISPECIES: DUF928 domain-containing protein [Oscillatoriales]MBD2179788.1 DUF928 domain-containing protein [Aerosakkonema funiforme FACHB-1375]
MNVIKLPLTLSTLLVAVGLQTAIVPSSPARLEAQSDRPTITQTSANSWVVSQTYVPPNRQAPSTTVGGATRGKCVESAESLRALMPSNNLSLTTAEYPTLYWYIPRSTAKALKFELRDANENTLWTKTFTIPATSGIISFTLPKSELPPLIVGKSYHWYFKMLCLDGNSTDQSGNAIVDGWIERTEPSPTLVKDLEKATPSDRPALYAAAGIWQDSLTTLVELRRENPDDSTLARQWEKLLKSAGLDPVVEKPLVDCCTANR